MFKSIRNSFTKIVSVCTLVQSKIECCTTTQVCWFLRSIKCLCTLNSMQIPFAERSTAQVCDLSLAEFVVSNPAGSMIFVCCDCCVFSGNGLCDELITRPEESYRLWCFIVCDLETSRMKRSQSSLGRSATEKMYTERQKQKMINPDNNEIFYYFI